jgi:G:T-mismatch repair DNA endonuclease (very short patch repair protein)
VRVASGGSGSRTFVSRAAQQSPCAGGRGCAARLSDSGLEVKFEPLLRESGLPEPTYRSPVYDDEGRIGSIDYIWADHRIVLQTHGWRWHGHRQRWQRDIEQRRRLSVEGWKIIEVTRADLEKPDGPPEIVGLCERAFRNLAAFSPSQMEQTEPGWL